MYAFEIHTCCLQFDFRAPITNTVDLFKIDKQILKSEVRNKNNQLVKGETSYKIKSNLTQCVLYSSLEPLLSLRKKKVYIIKYTCLSKHFPLSLSETNNETIYSIKITQQLINCIHRILTLLYVHQV